MENKLRQNIEGIIGQIGMDCYSRGIEETEDIISQKEMDIATDKILEAVRESTELENIKLTDAQWMAKQQENINRPKKFPISACCNASVKTFKGTKALPGDVYICQSCSRVCDLAELNKEPPKVSEKIEELPEDIAPLTAEELESWILKKSELFIPRLAARVTEIKDKLNEIIKHLTKQEKK